MSMTDTSSHDPEQIPNVDRIYRVLSGIAVGALLLLVASLAALSGGIDGAVVEAAQLEGEDSSATSSGIGPSRLILSHLKVRDTVYTTDSVYLEVDLSKQNVTVRRRDGSSQSFLISSGTPYIREGMATPAGIFTVQNMTPMALSRQFNNARLHHWIGVQGGVGFHGLDGSGYYGYLGVRPSSHGCIRMAREAIKTMYGMVHPGAIIMVHNGDPARVVAFCDPRDTVGADLIDSASVFNRALGKERLQALMEGRAFIEPRPRLVHLAHQRLRWGMGMERASRIPRQQLPEGFSMIAGDELVAYAPSDVTAHAQLGELHARAEHLAASEVDRKQTAWNAEPAPEYGN
jgi:hypothetical protein